MIIHTGNVYEVRINTAGNSRIVRLHDNADCFLQGDDSTNLINIINQLETLTHPVGPFATFAQHLDTILDDYESIIR